jgi:hypothetical protein
MIFKVEKYFFDVAKKGTEIKKEKIPKNTKLGSDQNWTVRICIKMAYHSK